MTGTGRPLHQYPYRECVPCRSWLEITYPTARDRWLRSYAGYTRVFRDPTPSLTAYNIMDEVKSSLLWSGSLLCACRQTSALTALTMNATVGCGSYREAAMERDRVVVRVPASSANMGPGYDCLGMALGIWSEVAIERSTK